MTSSAPYAAKVASVRERGGGIQSLERASAILDAVAAEPYAVGLAAISARVGLHTSTAHHLVKTLVAHGLLVQSSESKRYRVGPRLFALAASAFDESMFVFLATPMLEELSSVTGEAAHLAIRSRDEIVVIARAEAAGLLQFSGRTGSTRPAHATAIGKMLLALMPRERRDALIDRLDLKRFTAATMTDRNALNAELDDIARDVMAHDRGELDPDVRCLAVPVFDFCGRPAAALGISGPAWRMSGTELATKTRLLRACATRLSSKLGVSEHRNEGR